MKLVSFSINDGLIRPGALLEDGNLVLDLSSALRRHAQRHLSWRHRSTCRRSLSLLPARRCPHTRAAL